VGHQVFAVHGILALSFYSMHDAMILAEAEPFKTAISLRFLRAWPFVLFVVAILLARAVHRAVLLPLSVPARGGAGHSGQAEDL
jgi:polyferredoxin